MYRSPNVYKFLLAWMGVFIMQSNAFNQIWNPNHKIGTVTGKYHYTYTQVPDQLIDIYSAANSALGLTHQWYSSDGPGNWVPITGATQSSYTFSAPLTKTTYFLKISTKGANQELYSNYVKLSLVSDQWEDANYIREHVVVIKGVTTKQAVDQLQIGDKFQTTSFMDGLGRSLQKVSREIASPASGSSIWGDVVEFSKFDELGRESTKYLPYTTTEQPGKLKSAVISSQAQYYSTVYNETAAFSTVNFDNSPLNRATNIRKPGTAWAASQGLSMDYDMNETVDDVQNFSFDYVQGNAPLYNGAYPIHTLFKMLGTDENGSKVVEYKNLSGELILRKVQVSETPTESHTGWICTYYIYDDFGQLRFQLQPEAVNYLQANGWSFAGVNGAKVLAELVFQYSYDDKGRTIWKKAPGALPLNMLYDIRDRVVFMQDGNQRAKSPGQWTTNLYDELDRPVITTLYNTPKTVTQLQNDINAAVQASNITTVIPGTSISANLTVNVRQAGVAKYTATNTIEFTTGFESLAADAFETEINPNAASQAMSITSTTLLSPISNADLNNGSVSTILKYYFYDHHSYEGVKPFHTGFSNTQAYATSEPIVSSKRTINFLTGTKVRVLGTTTFLSNTFYLDEEGRTIQVLEENIKNGQDITTMQYGFDGRLLSTDVKHSASNTGYQNFTLLTKNLYDKIGRVNGIEKKIGTNAFKKVSSYEFDDMGRLKTKRLDPGYTAGGNADLESLDYSYNLQNQITGINKDFALKTSGNYNKWGHFFGLYLGFDNRDGVFTKAELNGQVTGLLWNTQGDDAQRKYDYRYDRAKRLLNANFTEQQHTGDGWSSTKMDFSVSGVSGQITYDLNGNLLTMLQKGVIAGGSSPITLDDLRYNYAPLKNKLESVTDQMIATSSNGQSGDFKDGANGANPDYVYDDNGNVVIDLNKNAQSLNNGAPGTNGIKYNHLDKPEEIRIVGKGTIKILYSADGEKLQRIYTPETGSVSVTSYVNAFEYKSIGGNSDALKYIRFEEGRIRVIQPTSQTNGYDAFNVSGNLTLPNGKEGAYDYFILDYQSNVRMVVTEQQQSASNIATMETARSGQEAPVFGQTGPANELEASRFATPSAWNNATVGQQVSRLGTLSGRTLGPNTLQKVMAGDKISATVQYFHQATPGASSPISTVVLNTLGQLLSGTNSVSSIVKGNATAITSQLGANPGFIDAVQPTGAGGNTPQAYLTILFFDERFNFISAADGGVAQQQVAASVGAGGSTLGLGNIKAPKNGYAMVYVSNRSEQPVYFDNLQVGKVAGNILEENHYYAYGLRIAAISSRKFGDVSEGEIVNQFLYNGKEMLDEDADLGWIDYGFRNYDPQIGRFQQADPISDELSSFSLYHYAFNDPIGNIDYMGLAGVDPIKVLGMVKDAVVTQNSFLKEIVIKAPRITKAAKTGLETASKSKLLEGAVKLAWGSIDFINTYANPITPIFEFVSGKDFNHGNFDIDKPRLESAAEAGTYFVGGKIVSGAVKSFSKPVINSLYKSTLKGSSEAAAKRGWKVGDAISNLTAKGNIPSWSTVRQRFWKNEAFLNASKYSQNNLLRMQKGLAPQRLNPNTGLMESMELHHHILPQRNGGLFDFMKVWPDEHRAIDPFRR